MPPSPRSSPFPYTTLFRSKSPPPSVRDPAVAVASGGDAAWRTFGERMLELERQEWRSRAFSRAEMRRQNAAGRDRPAHLGARKCEQKTRSEEHPFEIQ